MDIKDYVKEYNLSFDEIKSKFKIDFDLLYDTEKDWLENLENKVHLLKDEEFQAQIFEVINRLKSPESFNENDSKNLATFVSKIDAIVRIADRINNFKEGTSLDNGTTLKLFDLFNSVKASKNLASLSYPLNSNLNTFLPHIFSVIKHCQNPEEYPIYYKFWKNILREVLSKKDDYDSLCALYRSFPSTNRHLNFATYLGTIGLEIAKNIGSSGIPISTGSKEYKYLTNKVVTIEKYSSILDEQLDNSAAPDSRSKQYWLYAPGENASKWEEFYDDGIMALGWDKIGDLTQFSSRKTIKKALVDAYGGDGSKKNDVTANDDFLNKINIGDIVIAKKGRGELLGYGEVISDYTFDENRKEYQKIRKVDWKQKGNWKVDFSLVLKTLTDITKYATDDENYNTFHERLLGIMGNTNKIEKIENMNFSLNTILYGPPGTGKTHNTILRAAEIVENRKIDSYDEALAIFKSHLHNQIEFITFHQNYSYEDFIQGLRPDTENDKELTFEKKDGIFKIVADKALKNITASELPPVAKKTFEETFNEFVNPLVEGEVEEIEVKMKKVSYFITAVTNKSIEFRKTSGGTEHTLSISTLRKMYDAESVLEIQGLSSYYIPLLDELLKIGKDSSGKKETVQRKNYVIIIDEINRANISRVFGELITLIEPDKRSHGTIPLEARLPSGDPFIVPSNLYIIGTMNTADKSIALLDIALRRRFEFESMYPRYEIEGQEIYHVHILRKINEQIIKSKGHDFQIGHAYFMGDNKDLVLRMNKKVIPLLLEYYMSDKKEVTGILQSAGLVVEEDSWPLRITGLDV